MMKYSYRLFVFALVFSPLAFGTVEPWSLAVMETVSFLALALFFYRDRGGRRAVYEMPGIIPLFLFIAYIAFQLLPLPSGVIRVVSPGTYALSAASALADGPVGWLCISINPKATAMEFFRLTSYAACYILAVQLLADRALLKRTITVIAAFASFLAFLGIMQHILPNGRLFWIRELRQGGHPFGPYVNPDHYAGLMEMLFPLVLCLFLFYRPGDTYGSFRERLFGALENRMTNVHILLGLSAVVIATSIFLTFSRGGIASLCISTAAFGGMLMMKDKVKKSGKVIAVVFILILLSVGWFGWNPVFQRFGNVKEEVDMAAMRPVMWSDSLNIIGDFPLFGTGFGSFVHIYPKYRTISAPGILEHAHNDYLELFAESGIIGAALLAWFLVEVLLKSFRSFSGRKELYSIYLFAGTAAGLTAILSHGFVDFNLQVGANGLYFFFLLGLAVSAAHTRMREGLGETSLKKSERPSLGLLRRGSVLITALCIVFNIGLLLGEGAFASVSDLAFLPGPSKQDLAKIRDMSHRAALLDPLEASYYRGAADAEWRLGDVRAALADYRRAVRLDPARGEYVQMLGLLMTNTGQRCTTDTLLRAGIGLDGSNPEEYRRYASWLLAAGKKEEGEAMLKRAMLLQPANAGEYITLMVLYGLGNEEIGKAMPDLAMPRLLFAEYLSATGNDSMADEQYKGALDCASREKTVAPQFYYRIYRYYDGRRMLDDAVMVMNRAEEMMPEDAGIHLTAGDAYEKAGITYRAEEEYRKALIIDPNNDTARKKVEALRK